jgi:hypothetical protein
MPSTPGAPEVTRATDASTPRPVFIGGCGRSGTTLLGAMIGTHPRCLTTPESKFRFLPYRRHQPTDHRIDLSAAIEQIANHWSFKIWDVDLGEAELRDGCGSFPELLLRIVRAYGRKAGKAEPEVWIDHTPGNIKFASLLFDQFPGARLIHMVRDGRATASSVMGLDWGPNTVVSAAKWWVGYVTRGLAAESVYGPKRVKRVVYEDLVSEPERSLREVCDFLEIDYLPEMVDGRGFDVPRFTVGQHALVGQRPNVDRLQAWRQALMPRDVEMFESIAVDLLVGLGYEPVYGWRARRPTSREKVRLAFRELYRRHILNRMRLRDRIHRSVEDAPGKPEGGSGARS